jgi:hypothetical protein
MKNPLSQEELEHIALGFAKMVATERVVQFGRRPTPEEFELLAQRVARNQGIPLERAAHFIAEIYNNQGGDNAK